MNTNPVTDKSDPRARFLLLAEVTAVVVTLDLVKIGTIPWESIRAGILFSPIFILLWFSILKNNFDPAIARSLHGCQTYKEQLLAMVLKGIRVAAVISTFMAFLFWAFRAIF